jgi:glycosyltransferase involved in cell wall biosynthesis
VYGTQRLSKFMKYLARWGWNIVLLTTAPAMEQDSDKNAEALPDTVKVIRLPQHPTIPELRGWLVPDNFVGWIDPALNAARELVRIHRPAAIYATVPPYSNAVVAALLAMETGVPLVTDFRDPWTKVDTGWVIRNWLLRSLSAVLERIVLRTSSAIVMADEAKYADEFFVSSHRCRLSSILNGFDEEDFSDAHKGASSSKADKFVVSYVGTFYDDVTFLNVTRSFAKWQESFPSELDDVEFHYAGMHSRLFDLHGFRPTYLRDHGYVSQLDAIAIRAASSMQVFSQPPSFKPHVISGKIYEMMRLAVPILAITTPHGTVASFIEQTGTGLVVDNHDPDAASNALRAGYLAWKCGRSLITPNQQAIAAFSRESQAMQLSALMERITRPRTRYRAQTTRDDDA